MKMTDGQKQRYYLRQVKEWGSELFFDRAVEALEEMATEIITDPKSESQRPE